MGIIGVDLGGTNLRVGYIEPDGVISVESKRIKKGGTENEILDDLFMLIDKFSDKRFDSIGIGVPSILDEELGIVYDVQNIPSWKEVHLKEILKAKYNIPIYLNNDANCFVLGEKYFGYGKYYKNVCGLIIGTGLGAGLILNGHLYCGRNCGAGEFGMIPYKDHNLEYYCSGQYFNNVYNISGEEVFQKATMGNEKYIEIFSNFGRNLGDAINIIMLAIDPEIIILGGSVAKSYPFFKEEMFRRINEFPYQFSIKNIKIKISELNHISIYGAAVLGYERLNSISDANNHRNINSNFVQIQKNIG